MSELESRTFSSRPELDEELARNVAAALEESIVRRGQGILVVSGGSTPLHFFHSLSRQDLPWEKVVVTLADDRWLAPDHRDSNEKLVREHLLINQARGARFLPLKNDAATPQEGADKLDALLKTLGRFSVVILGMGSDGHTASLFPGATALAEGLNMDSGKDCIGVEPLTAPHLRMSLTLPRLLNTEHLIIHITGDEKKAILEKARGDNDPDKTPISAVLNQGLVPVTLYWAE